MFVNYVAAWNIYDFKGGGEKSSTALRMFILWKEAGSVSYLCLLFELFAAMNNYTRMSHFIQL